MKRRPAQERKLVFSIGAAAGLRPLALANEASSPARLQAPANRRRGGKRSAYLQIAFDTRRNLPDGFPNAPSRLDRARRQCKARAAADSANIRSELVV